jgi:nitrogen fixation/metabolism regulation signal transduction histidine kinase
MTGLSYERRLQILALAAGFPGSLVALLILWLGNFSSQTAWTLTIFIVIFWVGFAVSVRQRVVFSLQTLSNLIAAMREEDFSIRARGARRTDAMGEVVIELNALSETLRQQRLGALEATALLRTVMEEIDIAVFTFDEEARLRLINRCGERLLGRRAEQLLGSAADQLGLEVCLQEEPARTIELAFPGGSGRWGLRRSAFRQGGVPHQLVVLADLSRTLREEERQAWQRLLRVLGHELNNSLAPIQSVAESMETTLQRSGMKENTSSEIEDVRQGVAIIRSRTEALGRFMAAYSRLARLPQPTLAPVDLAALVRRVAKLEVRIPIELVEGPRLTISGDRDQLEQLLINLVRNAADAAMETGGRVRIQWSRLGGQMELSVFDEGPGISNPANLFVPFFTTKPGGSGIGLVLSRQIAEAHGGSLTLENRTDRQGSVALLSLPI